MTEDGSIDERNLPSAWFPGVEIAIATVLGGAVSGAVPQAINALTNKSADPFVIRVLQVTQNPNDPSRFHWSIELRNQTTSGAAITGARIGKKSPIALEEVTHQSGMQSGTHYRAISYPHHLAAMQPVELRATARVHEINTYVELALEIHPYNAEKMEPVKTNLACIRGLENWGEE